MTVDPLARIRTRLTAWYTLTFAGIVALLGGGLLLVLQRQYTEQLDGSLHEALSPVVKYARRLHSGTEFLQAVNSGAFKSVLSDDRHVFFAAADGGAVGGDTIPGWTRPALITAAKAGASSDQTNTRGDRTLRLRTERLVLADGAVYVAGIFADRDQMDDRFEAMFTAFGTAAIIAIVLITGGGYVLVRKSLEPVATTLLSMRRFMADAAHELQTPITVIRSRAEVAVQQPRESAAYTEALHGISREAERVGNIVGDLLTLARADAGERKVEHVPFYLDDIVVDATSSARVLADGRGVTIVAERFEETPLVGDPTLVRQLAVILLHNAVKFTPSGGTIRLSVSVTSGSPTLVVTDNGAGIEAGQLPRVFERFYRAAETVAADAGTREHSGAGLGLAIAQWIADAHHATIDIVSAVKVGTQVTVQFPAAR
jgi:signal transduction histidine kinase